MTGAADGDTDLEQPLSAWPGADPRSDHRDAVTGGGDSEQLQQRPRPIRRVGVHRHQLGGGDGARCDRVEEPW
ncbi:MAG: hypothetical protein WKF72_08690, partial [Nocardioidaceae bacterium]